MRHRQAGSAAQGPRSSRAGRERGATLVEAAYATPIFVLLVFAIIEMSLAMNNYLALSHSVRAGARTASAAGDDIYADYGVLRSVNRESSAIKRRDVDYIVIYKASAFGDKPSPTCQSGSSVSGVCNVYTPAAFDYPKSEFGCRADRTIDRSWCPTSRKVSITGTGTEYVGVWIRMEHRWVTGMFGTTRVLDDSSVIRLEPQASA